MEIVTELRIKGLRFIYYTWVKHMTITTIIQTSALKLVSLCVKKATRDSLPASTIFVKHCTP